MKKKKNFRVAKRYQYQRFPEFLAKHATLRERTEHGGTRGQKTLL